MLLWRSEWKGLLNTRTTVSTSFYEWQMIPRASWSTQNVMRVGLVKTPLDPLSFAVCRDYAHLAAVRRAAHNLLPSIRKR